MVSAVGKLFYAFVWQEQIFDIPFIQDPEANANGADMIATVNNFLNGINSFEYYEQNFQVCQTIIAIATYMFKTNMVDCRTA